MEGSEFSLIFHLFNDTRKCRNIKCTKIRENYLPIIDQFVEIVISETEIYLNHACHNFQLSNDESTVIERETVDLLIRERTQD